MAQADSALLIGRAPSIARASSMARVPGLDEFAVPHSAARLRELCDRFARAGARRVAIERPDGPVVDALMAVGFEVVVVSSRAVKALRTRFGLAGNKDDRGDAYVFAECLRTDGHRWPSLEPDTPATVALRAAVRPKGSGGHAGGHRQSTPRPPAAGLPGRGWPLPRPRQRHQPALPGALPQPPTGQAGCPPSVWPPGCAPTRTAAVCPRRRSCSASMARLPGLAPPPPRQESRSRWWACCARCSQLSPASMPTSPSNSNSTPTPSSSRARRALTRCALRRCLPRSATAGPAFPRPSRWPLSPVRSPRRAVPAASRGHLPMGVRQEAARRPGGLRAGQRAGQSVG